MIVKCRSFYLLLDLVTVYIPTTNNDRSEALSKLYHAISKQQTAHSDGFLILAEDFNHADLLRLCFQMYRGNNTLDLVNTTHKGAYKANSPHRPLWLHHCHANACIQTPGEKRQTSSEAGPCLARRLCHIQSRNQHTLIDRLSLSLSPNESRTWLTPGQSPQWPIRSHGWQGRSIDSWEPGIWPLDPVQPVKLHQKSQTAICRKDNKQFQGQQRHKEPVAGDSDNYRLQTPTKDLQQ